MLRIFCDLIGKRFLCGIGVATHPSGDRVLWTSWSQRVRCREGWGWMENLRFLSYFLRPTVLHYIYPNPRFSVHIFRSVMAFKRFLLL